MNCEFEMESGHCLHASACISILARIMQVQKIHMKN